MPIKVVVICNNFGKTFDGIGAYSKVIVDSFSNSIETMVFTAQCNPNVKTPLRFLTLGMTKQLFSANHYIKNNNVNCIVMEYPFIEWNPFIMFAYKIMVSTANRRKVPVILSVHEYERVNWLRKAVTRFLAGYSNYLAVTNEEMGKQLFEKCSNVFIRRIPSNISCDHSIDISKKKYSEYVYFGLVGKSKAFYEMIDAWKIFNNNEEMTLNIISGSKIEGLDGIPGIRYYYNLPTEEVLSIMEKCTFSIIPVRPYIDEKNATLKASCIAGCIPIGIFSKDLAYMSDFRIDMIGYRPEDILAALQESKKMNQEKILEQLEKVLKQGNDFLPNKAATLFENQLVDISNMEY